MSGDRPDIYHNDVLIYSSAVDAVREKPFRVGNSTPAGIKCTSKLIIDYAFL